MKPKRVWLFMKKIRIVIKIPWLRYKAYNSSIKDSLVEELDEFLACTIWGKNK